MKFAVLALVGATAATKDRRVHRFRQSVHKKFHCLNTLFGEVETCPAFDPTESMKDTTFFRKAGYAIHNAAIKGWFADNRDFPVDQKCMGDWMEPMFQKFHDIHSAWQTDGIWGVDVAQIKSAFDDLIDAHFINVEACGMKTIMWENYNWCYNNLDQCIFQHGMIDRLTENGLEFMGDAFQLFNIKKQDPTCLSDQDLIDRWAEETLIVTSGLREFHGFPGHFDTSLEVPHMTWHEMHNNMKASIHEHKKDHKCPVKAFFEHILKGDMFQFEPQQPMDMSQFAMPPFFQFNQPAEQFDMSDRKSVV